MIVCMSIDILSKEFLPDLTVRSVIKPNKQLPWEHSCSNEPKMTKTTIHNEPHKQQPETSETLGKINLSKLLITNLQEHDIPFSHMWLRSICHR